METFPLDQVENDLINSGHSLDEFLSSIEDFSAPTEKLLALYYEVYERGYTKEEVRAIHDSLFAITNIKQQVIADIESLGFKISEKKFTRGITNFSILIEGVLYQREVKNILYEMGEEKQKQKLEQDFQKLISETQSILKEGPFGRYDTQKLLEKVNHFFISKKIFRDSDIIHLNDDNLEVFARNLPDKSINIYFICHNKKITLEWEKKLSLIVGLIIFYKKRKEFFEFLSKLGVNEKEKETIQQEKYKYGAKGSYLRFLERLKEKIEIEQNKREEEQKEKQLNSIQELIQNKGTSGTTEILKKIGELTYETFPEILSINLAPSIFVPIELYEKWVQKKDISDEVKDLYNQIKELQKKESYSRNRKRVIVRSSAVFSEDNDQTSGAGIYESIGGIEDLKSFGRAIIKVFKSINSKRAKRHQKEYNIDQEKMGLVIQVELTGDQGYLNTTQPNNQEFMYLRLEGNSPVVFEKLTWLTDMLVDRKIASYFCSLFQNADFEENRIAREKVQNMMKLCWALEFMMGKPLQFEFIQGLGDEENTIVQMRPLVVKEEEKREILFPTENELFEGRCSQRIDKIVSGEHIVIVNNSHKASIKGNFGLNFALEKISFNEIEAIIIKDSFSTMTGHIETLCHEKGILCITNNPFSHNGKKSDILIDSKSMYRIVSDGQKVRIYKSSSF